MIEKQVIVWVLLALVFLPLILSLAFALVQIALRIILFPFVMIHVLIKTRKAR